MPVAYYNANANRLAAQYLSLPFEQVHHSWAHMLDQLPTHSHILDIGAGVGRDAR